VGYQAWVALQWGQPTEVETGASKTKPQPQLYVAWSSVGSAPRLLRGMAGAISADARLANGRSLVG
jgi:hypothetical protein